MTHITDAHEFLVKARLELGRAVVKTDDGKEANILFDAAGHVRKALDLLNMISQPGTSPQQTGDGANLSPAGDEE